MCFFFFKQKTAYEMRISDWSSDVCSSDLGQAAGARDDKLRMRASAGEGYATALAVKARQAEFDAAYQDLFKRAAASASTPGAAPTPGQLPSQAEPLRVCRSMGTKPFQDRHIGRAS